jgi:anti-anti-sigma factor
VIGETTPLQNAVQSLSNVNAIVLDLTRVTRIDARGLGVLLELRGQIQAKGIEFRLMNVTRLIGQVLELTCLNSVFEISSQAEVLSMVAQGATSASPPDNSLPSAQDNAEAVLEVAGY